MKRREFLTTSADIATGAALLSGKANAQDDSTKQWKNSYSGGPMDVTPLPPGLPNKDYVPVIVPNGGTLPLKSLMVLRFFT